MRLVQDQENVKLLSRLKTGSVGLLEDTDKGDVEWLVLVMRGV